MKNKKKILIMYDSFSEHGGVERIMLFQANALKRNGYDVSFAFAHVDEKLREEKLNGFKVIEYSKLPFKNETMQICASVLRKSHEKIKGFDLIICHYFPSSYTALRAKKKFNIPYILHLHHPPQFLYNADLAWAKNTFKRQFSFAIGKIFRPVLRALDNYCVRNADGYFAESKIVQKIIKETYKIDSKVLYPTINEKLKPKRANLYSHRIKSNYILGSGRIIRQKRFDYLIGAVSLLKRKMPVILAGKYEEKEKNYLEDLAKEKNVELVFLGPLDIKELVKFYSNAKLVVLTCPKEWFGLVPIEAMASGTPVVAWKDGFGPEETIIDNIGGYLAKPYSIKDMAEKIKKAINKKWDKKKIIKSIKKFREKEQEKILLKEVRNIMNKHGK